MEILPPLCEACRKADSAAFSAVMAHLRRIDESEHTVIMVQVENETGRLGTDREYSEEASRLFQAVVPAEFMAFLDKNRNVLGRSLKSTWSAADFRRTGTWSEVFGELAPEAFSAWCVVRYVDAVATAGKKAYDFPMYANNWLVNPGNVRAGRWPGGGPTEHVLDIWKAAAPHIDILVPDIYHRKFYETCAEFTQPDSPLFVPEVMFSPHDAANVFYTFATFNGMGFSPFGIDHAIENGSVTVRAVELEDSYRVLSPLLPWIARTQYTGRLHAVVQGEEGPRAILLGDKLAAVVRFTEPYSVDGPRGGGLIIKLAADDFVVLGAGFSVNFCELEGPPRDAEFPSLAEGKLEGDWWTPLRRLNGDELRVSLPAKARILRVRLIRPKGAWSGGDQEAKSFPWLPLCRGDDLADRRCFTPM